MLPDTPRFSPPNDHKLVDETDLPVDYSTLYPTEYTQKLLSLTQLLPHTFPLLGRTITLGSASNRLQGCIAAPVYGAHIDRQTDDVIGYIIGPHVRSHVYTDGDWTPKTERTRGDGIEPALTGVITPAKDRVGTYFHPSESAVESALSRGTTGTISVTVSHSAGQTTATSEESLKLPLLQSRVTTGKTHPANPDTDADFAAVLSPGNRWYVATDEHTSETLTDSHTESIEHSRPSAPSVVDGEIYHPVRPTVTDDGSIRFLDADGLLTNDFPAQAALESRCVAHYEVPNLPRLIASGTVLPPPVVCQRPLGSPPPDSETIERFVPVAESPGDETPPVPTHT